MSSNRFRITSAINTVSSKSAASAQSFIFTLIKCLSSKPAVVRQRRKGGVGAVSRRGAERESTRLHTTRVHHQFPAWKVDVAISVFNQITTNIPLIANACCSSQSRLTSHTIYVFIVSHHISPTRIPRLTAPHTPHKNSKRPTPSARQHLSSNTFNPVSPGV